jgi:4,5-dihydroxyphthalate decarboxylase
VDVRHAADGVALSAMLESGELDALVSVDVPRALLNGSTKIARLFPDYEAVERDYYRRTGIFPTMHVVAVPRELARQTDLVTAIYRAFCQAKDIIQQEYRNGALKQHMGVLTPWLSKHFEENRALLGEDWWPYGLDANRKAVDTFLRYHYEQGLSKRLLTAEDIIVPALMGT